PAELDTRSLHDALPIFGESDEDGAVGGVEVVEVAVAEGEVGVQELVPVGAGPNQCTGGVGRARQLLDGVAGVPPGGPVLAEGPRPGRLGAVLAPAQAADAAPAAPAPP